MVHSVVQVDYRKKIKKGIFYPRITQRVFFQMRSKRKWSLGDSLIVSRKKKREQNTACVRACVYVRASVYTRSLRWSVNFLSARPMGE